MTSRRDAKSLADWRRQMPSPPRRSRLKPCEEEYVYLGDVVVEQCARLKLTRSALAKALGVHQSTVSRICTGTIRTPVHEYPRLARVLRIRVTDLFPPDFLEEG